MPKIFAKVSRRYQTPYVAVITLGVLTVALIATNSLLYIAELSLFAIFSTTFSEYWQLGVCGKSILN